MRGIFISYRREDSEGQAGRLFDDLVDRFGRDLVFMDVAKIKKGLDFRRSIEEQVASCGVLLVIIGRHWLDVPGPSGTRRLDDANDFVRLETAAALARDIPVVPVLVQGATMPREADLPEPLKSLAFRNGTELTHARWDSDVQLLIDDLHPYVDGGAPPAPPRPDERKTDGNGRSRWVLPSIGLGVVVAALLGYAALHKPSVPEPKPDVATMEAACLPGFAWRLAVPDDHVCVAESTRQQTAADNARAASRRDPKGGAYGAATCREGFVWRESRPGDTVCVDPEARAAAYRDNALAPSRAVAVGTARRP